MFSAAPNFRRLLLVAAALLVAPLRGDERALGIARIHVEAIGGMARVRELAGLRMTGQVTARGASVPVVLLAARPNRIRMETRFPDRTVVQAYDGANPPWELDPAHSAPAEPRALSPAAAERFLADAEFDDPLVRRVEGKATVEFAGETEVRGRRLLRLLVARTPAENIFILLDPETYLIAFRVQELARSGRRVEIVTRYDNFRPVAGVLLAHEVTLFVDGALSQQARMDRIEPNPEIAADIFTPPAARKE